MMLLYVDTVRERSS